MTDFEQLYNTYFSAVYQYILRLSGNEHIAEEVTGETFFKAMKSIDGFRGDCDVRVWLCQIAKHSYYTYLRKHSRTQSIDDDGMEELPDPSPDVAETVARRDALRQIQKILHGISDPYKEVFMWRVYGGLSFREIAQIFGKTENWACVTYHRARKIIKERLEGKHHENRV